MTYQRTATWTGAGSPTPIAAAANGVVQGIASVYDRPNSASCSSSVGTFLSDSVTATIMNPNPPNYLVTGGAISGYGVGSTITADFTLTATAQGDEGYGTAQGSITFNY